MIVKQLDAFHDDRGWLMELYRSDEIGGSVPVMGYLSETRPGVTRGPHMHRDQTDHFVVFGPGEIEFCIWDDRPDQPSFGNRMVFKASAERPLRVTVPPMVVHAYRNTGDDPCWLTNFPDALYAGQGRKSPVDEIRFEDVKDHPFRW